MSLHIFVSYILGYVYLLGNLSISHPKIWRFESKKEEMSIPQFHRPSPDIYCSYHSLLNIVNFKKNLHTTLAKYGCFHVLSFFAFAHLSHSPSHALRHHLFSGSQTNMHRKSSAWKQQGFISNSKTTWYPAKWAKLCIKSADHQNNMIGSTNNLSSYLAWMLMILVLSWRMVVPLRWRCCLGRSSSGTFLVISGLGKYDGETICGGRIIYIPLAKLRQRPTFVLLQNHRFI